MKRIINISIMLMLLTGIVVTSALYLTNIYGNNTELEESLVMSVNTNMAKVLDETSENSQLLDSINDDKEYGFYYVSPEGKVLSETESLKNLGLDESDVSDVIFGVDNPKLIRSDKLGENYYVAFSPLSNGDFLVTTRLTYNVFKVFYDVLPAILGLIGLSIFVGFYITRKIVDDFVSKIEDKTRDLEIDNVDADSKYVELYPLIRIIKDQREKLSIRLIELGEKSNTLDAIISGMKEGMVLTDSDLNILSINRAATNLLDASLDSDKYLNKNLKALIRNEEFLSKINNKDIMSNLSFNMELNIKNRFVSLRFSPVLSDERCIGYVVLLMDDTKQKLLEAQRSEFTANVSHELKTPLTSINGYAEMLKNNMVPGEDVSRFGDIIYSEGVKLLMMIDDIIKLSKLDEGKNDSKIEDNDLSKIVLDVVSTLDHKIQSRNIKINFTPSKEYFFNSNYQLMRELFMNLIDNGIKYNKENGEIDIDIDDEGFNYVIKIADTGIGISEENQGRIFERFYTVDKSHNKKDSSGLGLAIVKHIVRLYRGSITFESEIGVGTTFIIRLPKNTDN